MIYEAGDELAQSERFLPDANRLIADVDLDRLAQERLRQGSMDDNARANGVGAFSLTPILFEVDPPETDLGLRRPLDRFPFVPDDPARLNQDCYEAYNIQVSALERRMLSMSGGVAEKAPTIVIGVSGGLDSTHALIVAAKACDRLGLPRTHILAFTLPEDTTIETTCQVLEAAGVPVEARTEYSVYFRDPDGRRNGLSLYRFDPP